MSLLPGGCCGGMKISDLLSSLEGCDVANTCSLYVHSVTLDSMHHESKWPNTRNAQCVDMQNCI